jgi:hypothetical protein
MCWVNGCNANYREHSVDIGNYIMEQYNIEAKTNYRQALEKIHISTEK